MSWKLKTTQCKLERYILRELRNVAYQDQQKLCFHCGKRMNPPGNDKRFSCTAEHLRGLAEGGRTEYTNIVAVHKKCNK